MPPFSLDKPALTPQMRRGITRWILQAVVGTAGYGAILFLSAGTWRWGWGWLFMIVLTLFLVAHPLILIPTRPDLLVERQKGTLASGVKNWDKWLTSLAGGGMILIWIVAGLDLRFGWTPSFPLIAHLLGLAGVTLGYTLFLWAMFANPFFSEGVRIQTERDHIPATSGPYRFVRHPGYSGVILSHLAMPLLLGSPWGLLPAAGVVVLFLIRTHLEDQMLLAELAGYDQYARQTPYRLIPGIW